MTILSEAQMTIIPSIGDLQTAAKTLYGESRGEADIGQQWCAATIICRAERGGWWGSTLETVCRKSWQYSCWNKNDPNREILEALPPDDEEFLRAMGNLTFVLRHGVGAEPTHYHTVSISPDWADSDQMKFIRTIGRHHFYVED
jgi:spore germination cell wall hydrolase CwlJ-like protein